MNSHFKKMIEDKPVFCYGKKQVIYSEGNHFNGIYYVLSGKVKTFITNDDGKSIITDLFSEGDIFGYIPFFKGSNYYDSAVVVHPSQLVFITIREFEALFTESKEFAGFMVKLLAKDIYDKEHRILSVAYGSLRKKVAETLLQVNAKLCLFEASNGSIKMGRSILAEMAGTATESLVRTLSDFQQEKLINIDKEGNIFLLNINKLKYLRN